MADAPLQRRRVRCPNCPTILLEPPGTEVYECPQCSIYLRAKGTSSNSQKKALQGPSNENDGPTTSRHEDCSVIGRDAQGQDQLKNDETEEPMPRDKSTKQQEQLLGTGKSETMLVLKIRKKEDSQLQGISLVSVVNISNTLMAIGEEGVVMRAHDSLDCASRDDVIASKEGELADQAEVFRDHLMQQDISSKGDDQAAMQLPAEGKTFCDVFAGECVSMEKTTTQDDKDRGIACGMPIAYADEKVFTGECVSVDKTHQGECNVASDKHDLNYQSEIIRDTSCELSFKYIVQSNVQLEQNRTHGLAKLTSEVSGDEDKVTITPDLSLDLPSSKNESSDDYESYSSFSESATHDGSDSEFDFPAPLAESMGSAKLLGVFVQPKISEGPHQLEWQDADYHNGISTFSESNCSTLSSVGVVGKAGVEKGVKEEILEDGPHVNKSLLKIISTEFDDTRTTAIESSRVQRENGFLGIDALANKEGTVALERNEGSLVSSPNDDKPKDSSTSNLHSNAVDIVEDEKTIEKPASRAIAATRGDSENAHSGLRKGLGSAGVRSLLAVEQINLSCNGAINILQPEGHHEQDCFREEVQVHNTVEVGKMLDAKRHHKRNSSDKAHLLSSKDVASSSSTHQDRRKIHNEEAYISRTLGVSFRTHQGHVQADPMLAGLQKPQADLHLVGQTTQPFGSNIFFDGSSSVANTVCYQAPSHPLMLPMAMPGHGCNHHGCHPVGPVCMPYVHGQHSHVPQLPMSSCLLCLSTMGHHQEVGNYYQGYQVQASCMLCHSCLLPQIAHMHDTSMATTKPLVSSVKKPKHYPPLPQGRTAPYVVCRGCNDILEVPAYLPPIGEGAQKLRCGGCHKVSKFSFPNSIEKSHIVGLESSAVGSTRKALTSSPPSFEFMVKKRELPGANVGQSRESSYGQSLHSHIQRGSISSCHGVAHAVSTRNLHYSSQDETTCEFKSGQDESDTTIRSTISNHNSQDEFFFRTLSRKSEFDSSRRLFSGFKTMSSRFEVDNVGDDGLIGSDDVPLQCAVDEKEEGLDFGAPRPSDGESLDQRSPESRRRSPENFESVDQQRHRRSSFGDEDARWATEIQQEFGSKRNNSVQERRPGTSLFALLNQESTKFEITLEEKPKSPPSKSLGHDPTNQMSNSKNKEIGRPRNLRGQHFVRKGPRYIAAMLTRSLKHRVND